MPTHAAAFSVQSSASSLSAPRLATPRSTLFTAGSTRLGWDVQLTAYGDDRWRATFWVTGMAHSIVGGSAWEPTPWRAV